MGLHRVNNTALYKLLKFGESCDGNTEPSLIVILERCNDYCMESYKDSKTARKGRICFFSYKIFLLFLHHNRIWCNKKYNV